MQNSEVKGLSRNNRSTLARAPGGQMQGGATQAMRCHCRGAPTQQMPARRRTPSGCGPQARWLRCSRLTYNPVCSSLAPCQRAWGPAAKWACYYVTDPNREESGLCLYKAPWFEIKSSGCCAGSKLFSCASGMLLLEERRENSRARARDCATRAANPEPCKGIRAVRHIDHRRTQALLFLGACPRIRRGRVPGLAGADARRRDAGDVRYIVEERQRSRCPFAAGTQRAHGGCTAIAALLVVNDVHGHRLLLAPCARRASPMRATPSNSRTGS